MDTFFDIYPEVSTTGQEIDLSQLLKEPGIPDALLSLWKKNGVAGYMDGYLKFLPPKDLRPHLYNYIGLSSNHLIPFAITGFGDIICICGAEIVKEGILILYFRYGIAEIIGSSFDFWFTRLLAIPEYREMRLKNKLYREAVEKHGKLAINEIFAFTPILALGGSEKIQNIQIQSFNEHLSIINNSIGPIL